MARLVTQHLADVGERVAVVLFHVVDGGAPVPGFHVFRLDLDDGAEQLEGEIEILGFDRVLHARHQEHRGVAARVAPQRPDALLDRLGGDVVGRHLKRAEQEIEIARGIAARDMRQFLRRQHQVARRRQGGAGRLRSWPRSNPRSKRRQTDWRGIADAWGKLNVFAGHGQYVAAPATPGEAIFTLNCSGLVAPAAAV